MNRNNSTRKRNVESRPFCCLYVPKIPFSAHLQKVFNEKIDSLTEEHVAETGERPINHLDLCMAKNGLMRILDMLSVPVINKKTGRLEKDWPLDDPDYDAREYAKRFRIVSGEEQEPESA